MKRFKALSLTEKLFVLFITVVCPLNYLIKMWQPSYSAVALFFEIGEMLSVQDDQWLNSALFGFVVWTLLTLVMFVYGVFYTFGKFKDKRVIIIIAATLISLVGYYYRFFKPGFLMIADRGQNEIGGWLLGSGIKCLVLMLIFNTFFTVLFLRKNKKAKSN